MSVVNMIKRMEEGVETPPPAYERFAHAVDARMKELGLTTATLAQRMGVMPTSSLRNIVQGKAYPAKKTLPRLASALEWDTAQVRKLLGKPQRAPYGSVRIDSQRALAVFTGKPPQPDVASEPTVHMQSVADGRVRLRIDATLPLQVALQMLAAMKEVA